ncbi:MAG: phosphate/phosphite/phosphonate ABC transporter substrate-binding protein [Chloroflexi bacterium]|nr:phosphate/phosphite/phosphonate ABC transporter substrate-binding protein [Chloroflexota bacterium]
MTLVIGDISDEPTKKIERFLPLAEYLAANLEEFGYTAGDVLIASSIDDMARLVNDGRVDVYMDSPYPSLQVQRQTESELLLRRWKSGNSSYWSVFAARTDAALEDLESLRGRVVAAEEPFSTSGFALPVSELIASGIPVVIVDGPQEDVPSDTVGVWFTRDEENSVDALSIGIVPAAMFSNVDFEELPEDVKAELHIIGSTGSVPRQVTSVGRHVNPVIAGRISELLRQLEDSEEGLALLEHVKTARFDLIPDADSIPPQIDVDVAVIDLTRSAAVEHGLKIAREQKSCGRHTGTVREQ